jgi:hypothetical protein
VARAPGENFRYVRESSYCYPTRARRPRFSGGRLVAYAVLKPEAKSVMPGEFLRRVWWVADHDPYEDGGAPIEAVDPMSITAGHASKRIGA